MLLVQDGAERHGISDAAALERVVTGGLTGAEANRAVSLDDEIEQELIDYCRSSLAHFKCPTSIEFRDKLPRTATGKLQKFRMREMAIEEMQQET